MDWDQYCDISVYDINDYMDHNCKKRSRKKECILMDIKDDNESINEFAFITKSFYACIGILLSIKGFYYARSFKKR
jgi:hypothetical protein